MKDGGKQVSSKATSKGIFKDSKASPRAHFSSENENRQYGKLTNMTWFLRVGATGFEPANLVLYKILKVGLYGVGRSQGEKQYF